MTCRSVPFAPLLAVREAQLHCTPPDHAASILTISLNQFQDMNRSHLRLRAHPYTARQACSELSGESLNHSSSASRQRLVRPRRPDAL